MKTGRSKYFTVLLLFVVNCVLFTLPACKKEDIDSDTPTVELVSVSSSSIKEGDGLVFKIKYTDGDGDLGENEPNKNNLFLTDNRVNVTYQYRIQQVAPSGSGIIVKGSFNIELKSTAITDGSNSQAVSYSIYLKDRAGHTSTTVVTPAITISK
jgi:hypothetical protein